MIIVKQYFRGRETNERLISPGEYAEKDERLFGLAETLIEMGIAERVGGGDAGESAQAEKPDGPPKRRGRFVGVPDKPDTSLPQADASQDSAIEPDQADAPQDPAGEPDQADDKDARNADVDDTGRPKVGQ